MDNSEVKFMGFAAAFMAAAFPVNAKGLKDKPNVLFIQCDQQRYDCLGYNGNKIVSTPNIDALASQGMRFTRAYTAVPTSCPSRQCLLSGLWPEKHGGLWNYDITLPVRLFEQATWSERMQEKGMRMGYVGKWHVHPKKTPLDFGYDDYIANSHYQKWFKAQKILAKNVKNMEDFGMMGGYSTNKKENSSIHWFAEQALELIKKYEKEGKRWHLRLEYVQPHLPCFPVKEFYDKYANVSIPVWGNFNEEFHGKPYIQKQQVLNWGIENFTWNEWERYMRSYYGVISEIDDAIGFLMKELEKMGVMDETMVVYTTDHGDAAGSHRMLDKHYVMYEEEVHVPLVIRWDNVVKPGSVNEDFVIHNLDFAATMCDLFNLNHQTQGASLLPLLKGERPQGWREYAFSNYNGQQFGLFVERMIRDKRYKYCWNPTDVDEFYDLELDPNEMVNSINDSRYSEVIKRLKKELYEDLVRRGDPIVGRPSAARKQLLEDKKH